MNSLYLYSAFALLACLCIVLIGGLVVLESSIRRLKRTITDSYALQRMVTTHGEAQLSTDGRLNRLEIQLEKIQSRDLHIRAMAKSVSSIESASTLIQDSGVTDAERLAIHSGLTEREANLMLKLKSDYSTDISSPPDGAK